MRVQEYRDAISAALQLVADWSACVDDLERDLWRNRAIPCRDILVNATCSRASGRDRERHTLACDQIRLLLEPPKVKVAASAALSSSGQTRAARYNGSASRAVRLSRAARSAMRRGYL